MGRCVLECFKRQILTEGCLVDGTTEKHYFAWGMAVNHGFHFVFNKLENFGDRKIILWMVLITFSDF